ncbi:carbonic anhydrase [Streptomyces sp. NBC_00193]|uniref:carbonic anhydrase n=1 Tax=Streptomyces sp. NBC_00193 TaxID=2975675 RepID=UPI002257E751|nr:carbonic anhydrase [Streptomyces sp. NBC_00193]MCX5300859.1 carbonic anhydrase [Streptomyces sp. NBC_00193]
MDRAGLPPRRFVLTGGLTAAAALLTGCSAKSAPKATTAAPEPRPSTPEGAYSRLMEGNKRWVSGSLNHPDRDPDRRGLVAQAQDPFGVILACIDSRVPPELLFDTGLGDLFVLRTGGQAVGPVVTGSVEFGPMTAGTPLIMVLGHQRCGAIDASYKALREGKPLPGNLRAIEEALVPAYELTIKDPGADPVDTMIRNQIKVTADDLRGNADLAPLVGKGSLAVVGAYYSLDTGQVEILTGAPTGSASASPSASTSASTSADASGSASPSPSASDSASASPSASASASPSGSASVSPSPDAS